MPELILHLPDEHATGVLGRWLASLLKPGMVIFLKGDLGAGKTTLVRAVLRALGVMGPVKSPTYTLLEFYVTSRLNLYHFDFYRFNNPKEWLEAGFRDYFSTHTICLVEWPEKAGDLLPSPDLTISIDFAGEGRTLKLAAETTKGGACLQALSDFARPYILSG